MSLRAGTVCWCCPPASARVLVRSNLLIRSDRRFGSQRLLATGPRRAATLASLSDRRQHEAELEQQIQRHGLEQQRDRIARQEATLGKLNETALDGCIAKQDETGIRASAKLAEDLGIDGTPAVYVNGERVNGGAVPRDEIWMAIDRAVRAAGEQPPALPAPETPAPAVPAGAGAAK